MEHWTKIAYKHANNYNNSSNQAPSNAHSAHTSTRESHYINCAQSHSQFHFQYTSEFTRFGDIWNSRESRFCMRRSVRVCMCAVRVYCQRMYAVNLMFARHSSMWIVLWLHAVSFVTFIVVSLPLSPISLSLSWSAYSIYFRWSPPHTFIPKRQTYVHKTQAQHLRVHQ